MLRQNKYIFLFFGIFLCFSVFSQTKDELKKQKSSIEKEISYTNNLLNKTKAMPFEASRCLFKISRRMILLSTQPGLNQNIL